MKILTVVNRVFYRLVVLWWKRKHRQVLMSPSNKEKEKKKEPLSPLCVALSLPNVPLADKDTSVVDTLGKSKLEDLCLKPPLQEILDLQAQDIIELHLTLIEHTDSHQTPEQSVTWKTTHIYKMSFKHRNHRDVFKNLCRAGILASLTRNSWHHGEVWHFIYLNHRPTQTSYNSSYPPSNRRLGSFSSRVSSSLAALRILARVNLTLHTSRLFLSPYSP